MNQWSNILTYPEKLKDLQVKAWMSRSSKMGSRVVRNLAMAALVLGVTARDRITIDGAAVEKEATPVHMELGGTTAFKSGTV